MGIRLGPGVLAVVLQFLEVETTEVTITGRNLDKLYDQLGYHRIAWLSELSPERDFQEEEKAVVITGIAIKELEG